MLLWSYARYPVPGLALSATGGFRVFLTDQNPICTGIPEFKDISSTAGGFMFSKQKYCTANIIKLC